MITLRIHQKQYGSSDPQISVSRPGPGLGPEILSQGLVDGSVDCKLCDQGSARDSFLSNSFLPRAKKDLEKRFSKAISEAF